MASSRVPKFKNTDKAQTVHLNIHVPVELVVRLDTVCARERTHRRDEVIQALERHLIDREKRISKRDGAAA